MVIKVMGAGLRVTREGVGSFDINFMRVVKCDCGLILYAM